MVDPTGGSCLRSPVAPRCGTTRTWREVRRRGPSRRRRPCGNNALQSVRERALVVAGRQPRRPGLRLRMQARHRYDTDAGDIELMGARLYNPTTGRFLQVGPVFGGSCNAYDYVCQDSLNERDLASRRIVVTPPACAANYRSHLFLSCSWFAA